MAAVGTLVALLALTGITATAVQAASFEGFKLGLYSGTTSQHDKLSVKLAKISECGHSHGLCLFGITQGYVQLTCPEGRSTNQYIDPVDISVPTSGRAHAVGHVSDGSLVEESILVKHSGTITGTYKISKVPDSIIPEELTGYCSASVTYTLHRG